MEEAEPDCEQNLVILNVANEWSSDPIEGHTDACRITIENIQTGVREEFFAKGLSILPTPEAAERLMQTADTDGYSLVLARKGPNDEYFDVRAKINQIYLADDGSYKMETGPAEDLICKD